jgi:hypothetical protein
MRQIASARNVDARGRFETVTLRVLALLKVSIPVKYLFGDP